MTRLSLILATTTALCAPAVAEEAGELESAASEVYEEATTGAAEAAQEVETTTETLLDRAKTAYDEATDTAETASDSTIERTEETVETMAARAEMGEALDHEPLLPENRENYVRASDILGAELFTAQAAIKPGIWRENAAKEPVSEEWESIGTIAEMVVGPEGDLHGLVAEVSGLRELEDSHVLIKMSDLYRTQRDDDGQIAFVTWMSKETLENQRPVEDDWMQ